MRFRRYAWVTLAYIVLVILWGAFVRATGSGAGCGEHWPLCNGTVLQRSPAIETIIELSHRLSSGLSLVLVGVLIAWAFRVFPKGHAARHGVVLSGCFLLLEAAVGAGIVLLRLVATDSSALRAVSVAVHLFNTFLLITCVTYVAWYATRGRSERFRIRAGTGRTAALGGGLALFALVGIAGAIVALGDTLFPATSIADGLRQDASPTAHFLLRLRVLHPVLAVLAAGYTIFLATYVRVKDTRPLVARLARLLTGLVVVQIGLGTLNMLLLAPVWLQLVHLLVADLNWIVLATLALESLPVPDAPAAADTGATSEYSRAISR